MANVKDSILQWYLPLQIEKVTMSVNTERVVSIRYYGDGGLEQRQGKSGSVIFILPEMNLFGVLS
ncbi:MAG: hypothetical protein ACLUPL_02000 [Butyricimonas virosa]